MVGFDTQRKISGPYRGWDIPLAVENGKSTNPWRMAGSRMASHHSQGQSGTRSDQEIIFLLGYHENPADEKFDPPDSQTINKKTVKPVIEAIWNGRSARRF